MASLQKRKVNGNNYWYIIESKRINGKPRPVTIAFLGTVEKILDILKSSAYLYDVIRIYILIIENVFEHYVKGEEK